LNQRCGEFVAKDPGIHSSCTMKAMILAAGLGTRLRPLTDSVPKALLEVYGRPLLAWVVDRLALNGFTDIVVNAHHHAEQIVAFAEWYPDHAGIEGLRMAVSLEEDLLGTGGGLKQAEWFFDDDQPFLLHNADVITDVDLQALAHKHLESGALATLAVKKRDTKRYLLFDEEDDLCGWQSTEPAETREVRKPSGQTTPYPFLCVQILSPEVFNTMNSPSPYSLIDAYLAAVAGGHRVTSFLAPDARWMDVGRPGHLEQVAGLFGDRYFEALLARDRDSG